MVFKFWLLLTSLPYYVSPILYVPEYPGGQHSGHDVWCALSAKKGKSTRGCWWRRTVSRWKEEIILRYSETETTVSNSGLCATTKTLTYWSESSRSLWRKRGLSSTLCSKSYWDTEGNGFVQFGEKRCNNWCLQLGNRKIKRRWNQVLLRGAQQKNEEQNALAIKRNLWPNTRSMFFTVGGQVLAQAAQRVCGFAITGATQDLPV